MGITLRAHHILCIQGFRGEGYNEEFVSNMREIIKYLEDNKNREIKIVNSPDYICMSCPNNIGQKEMRKFEIGKKYDIKGFCENERHIQNLDNMVLKKLKIYPNSYHTYNSLLNKIKKNLTKEKFRDICEDCKWYSLGYCTEGIFQDKDNVIS